MMIMFIPSCDKQGCDAPSTHIHSRMGAKGHIKQMYYCDAHKKPGDASIIAHLEQARLDNRRKSAQKPDVDIVGSKLPMGGAAAKEGES